MADVVSADETEKAGKESNKYLLSAHNMPGTVLKNE